MINVQSLMCKYETWCQMALEEDEDLTLIDSQDDLCYKAANGIEVIRAIIEEIFNEVVAGI